MALGQSITFQNIKTALGETTNDLFLLCTSSLINKWSKYKPVRRLPFSANWPAADDFKYGFNLALGTNPNKWDYLQPRGGTYGGSPDEPAWDKDFRGYEHDRTLAFPSIQCRDTDNNTDAFNDTDYGTIYPSGSPFQNRWFVRAYRSASSVVILPSDLGLDNYYIGLKLGFGGATWYKTFGQVNAVDFSGTWNMLVNLTPVDWDQVDWSYVSFPKGTGLCTWQLFLSVNATTGWQNSLAGDIIYFPGIAKGGSPASYDTDGTNIYISNGSFTVHDWVKLTDYDLTFLGPASNQDVNVYCSTPNTPAFSISDDRSWITLEVYDGVTLINNPALYASGNTLRVSVSALTTDCIIDCQPEMRPAPETDDWYLSAESGSLDGAASRSGSVTVTSEGENAVISVSQGNGGSDQLTFAFTVDPSSPDFPAGDVDMDVWITRGANTVYSDLSGAKKGRMGFSKSYTVTINETGIAGETYTVHLRIH